MSYQQRFSGLARLYSIQGLDKLQKANVCVIGIGGVGSWIAEALARSGINQLTLIDLDDVSISNVNRQIHALDSTLNQSKIEIMAARIHDINPDCQTQLIEDFVTPDNVRDYINSEFDVVIDAADSVKAKAAIVAHCKRQKIKVICLGAAGGQCDPLKITRGDLAKTIQDPLLAKVRSDLRRFYNFSQNPKRNFGVECIYSTEQLKYPTETGGITQQKQRSDGANKMDCSTGFGAFVGVTASFGLVAASRAVDYIVNSKICIASKC
ncbi:molybdopterin biosynthesis MoeB protein [Glaciecola punicea ACAM 611]|jgi:tRNA A37 threonylcarbamoyladenosine dehydratase|uniref:tRNA threonylcarbamoyladenosine dehydratase n=1 Tax=Glaciecola punicea ACAM 611 TaxID=1121923 RepID=H5TA86_9ALTE|nr:tRNA cyclic N6-threonylcarbamoyladenosine(37) synthase TcdA [Glaciecola punicea]OFA33488.1 tRNA cyclic N6-threonylcarbamoyladenosine(37) synthase TcdA [Glaciecola punicea]GAB55213.1 molybdopterin biosynthesis MoeB protein [Glaciecola punicea ACAM 611]